MKVLHIIPDDKFWKPVIELFDMVNCDNDYVCIVNDDCQQFEYIKTDRIKMIHNEDAVFLWNRSDVDAFMFHSFPYEMYDGALAIPENKIIIVSSWGYDIYYSQNGCPPLVPLSLYQKSTKKLLTELEGVTLWKKVKRKIKHVLFYEKYQKILAQQKNIQKQSALKQEKVLERIDYWASVLPIEYDMLKMNNHFHAQYFPFQYTTRKSDTLLNTIDSDEADYILLGNSSDPSNNHLDLLQLLKNRRITNRLYLPLAYGNGKYKELVKQYVSSNGLDCIIQEDMMPIEQYKNILLHCRVGVFGHVRQQAMGNVIMCMLQGSKVFLYKDSIAYKYLKSSGYIVYNIEDELTQQAINSPMTKEEIELNRRKRDYFTIDHIVPRVDDVIKTFKIRI